MRSSVPSSVRSPLPRPRLLFLGVVLSILPAAVLASHWPQAGGADGDYSQRGERPPMRWSVTRGENIRWRTPLPESGQSGIAVWGDRLFLTTMKPLPHDARTRQGSDIVGYCLNASSGKILWSVELPGTEMCDYAYGFSDPSTPTPVTDGRHVWFVNSAGSMGCYDLEGQQVWFRRWQPTTDRPFNKQFEPLLAGGVLLNCEPREPGDPRRVATDPWNYVRALDPATGRSLWFSEDALTHYNTPVLGRTSTGEQALLMGRGGYHDVPEGPPGLTLTSLARGTAGRTVWRLDAPGKALYNMHWDRRYAYWFTEDEKHLVVDARTGAVLRTQSLARGVDYRQFDRLTGRHRLHAGIDLKDLPRPVRVFPGWFTNIAAAGYHYFLCFTDERQRYGPDYCLGRVQIETGHVEYLELPTNILRGSPGTEDRLVWHEPQSSSTVNSRGIDVAGDPRSRRDGWFWCFLGSPVQADGRLYFTTMLGVTYVVNASARVLDQRALLAVNDLGPRGETWSLNTPSCSGGRIYHRSMKEVVCIGSPPAASPTARAD